jgi:hypothetical protein
MAPDPFKMSVGSMDPGGSIDSKEWKPIPPALPPRPTRTVLGQSESPHTTQGVPDQRSSFSHQLSPNLMNILPEPAATRSPLDSPPLGEQESSSLFEKRETTPTMQKQKGRHSFSSLLKRAANTLLSGSDESTGMAARPLFDRQSPTSATSDASPRYFAAQSVIMVNEVQLSQAELSSLQALVGFVNPGSYW